MRNSRTTLTDRFIRSPKRVIEAQESGGRRDYPDTEARGLALRVFDTGHRSFTLIARFPLNPKNPTRRALGEFPTLSLEEARQRARGWRDLIRKGVDPRVEESRQRAAEERKQGNSFGHVAEEFLTRHAARRANPRVVRGIIERDFSKRWGQRPITDIAPEECAAAIRGIVKRGTPSQAHHAFAHLRRLFSWAIGTHEFGIAASPVDHLKSTDLIGEKAVRNRVLSDDEIRTLWQASDGLGFPYGPLVRLLLLTGQRLREAAEMAWPEVDLDKAMWAIPPVRMKSDRAHVIPLAPDALALLKGLPRFDGRYMFTTTGGAKPVNGFSKAKTRLDAKMKEITGENAAAFTLHDIRRTMRTHLSALPVQDLVREMVIAHARPGLHRIYDQWAYLDEKRQCLTLWEARLRGILNPKPPASVADIGGERARRRA